MIVYVNGDGTIQEKITSRYFQGSDGVNSIVLRGEFPVDADIKINFKLPDNSIYFDKMELINFGVWELLLTSPITDQSGRVWFSFTIKDNKRLTTPTISIFIEESIILDDIT